jgi:ABC-2 type transport system ATP-binding protein
MQPVIEVKDLTKRYKNAQTNAVDGVSFDVCPGEFFSLLGPNGAGKTTTISILTTTLSPTSGKIMVAGFDLAKDANAVRRSIGIIFQNPSLDLNLTAEENVRFHAILYGMYPFRPTFSMMPRQYREHVIELAEVVGIQKEIFKPVRTFSGGMKRKLEIIRSLIHTPRVLFLDEPTSGLDPLSRRNLWEYLTGVRRARGTTIFLTTHYLEEAEQADSICIINHGKIVSQGTPAQIKSDLVEDYVAIDAENRDGLRAELAALGIPFKEEQGVRIDLNGKTAHEILRAIGTPLTSVLTHTPTLEDAYLEIISASSEVEQ